MSHKIATFGFGLLACAASFSANAVPLKAPNRAVQVQFFSKEFKLDTDGFRRMKAVIAKWIDSDKVDVYVVTGRGIEGGMSFCLQMSANAKPEEFSSVLADIKAVKPDEKLTQFNVEEKTICPAQSKRPNPGPMSPQLPSAPPTH